MNEHDWGELVKSGTFEADKALMSLEAPSQTFLKSPTHKTLYDVFSSPTATLATVKKYRGEEKMLAMVESLLKSVATFLNVGKGMDERQAQTTARMIFDEYYYLTVADLKVCFRNGMAGKYGQLFDRLDGMIIFTWLETYAGERAQYAETGAVRNLKEKQATEKATHMPEWLSEKLREMQAKKTTFFNSKTTGNQRFATLAAFLESIEKTDSQNEILEAWENKFVKLCPEVEIDAWYVYKSNQLLYAVNLGKVKSWEDVQQTFKIQSQEIPEFKQQSN